MNADNENEHFQSFMHYNPQNPFGISQFDPFVAHGWPYTQTHSPLDASHLPPQHYTLVHSLSEEVLHASGNKVYLQLEKENLALRDRVDNLQTQLITAMNVSRLKARDSHSSICRTPSQLSSKPARISLRKEDYPNVKHWESACNSDSMDNTSSGLTGRECGVLAFLEDENGRVISHYERKRLYAELRGFWNDHIDPNNPPDNWSSAGATLCDKFRDILEEKFPFLCFCAGRWKVEVLWKKNYHSWKRSLLARQAKKTLLNTGGSDSGGKRKRKKTLDCERDRMNSDTEAEILRNGPQPKKSKTGMASISTGASQSQKRSAESMQLRNATLSSKTKNPLKGFSINTALIDHALNDVPTDLSQSSDNLTYAAPPAPLAPSMSSPTKTNTLNASLSVLKTLHEKVKNMPKSVPTAKKTGPLAGYCCNPVQLTEDIALDADVWEAWDPKLNVLISHSVSQNHSLVTRGKYGLIGLVQLLEHPVHDRKVDEGLLEGKIGRIIEAIDRHVSLCFAAPFTNKFNYFSVCKQRLKNASKKAIAAIPVATVGTRLLSPSGVSSITPPSSGTSPPFGAAAVASTVAAPGTSSPSSATASSSGMLSSGATPVAANAPGMSSLALSRVTSVTKSIVPSSGTLSPFGAAPVAAPGGRMLSLSEDISVSKSATGTTSPLSEAIPMAAAGTLSPPEATAVAGAVGSLSTSEPLKIRLRKKLNPVESTHVEPVTKKLAGETSKGGRGSWTPPKIISAKWEAARDWKDANPRGTKQDFIKFWDTVQQENDKLQVYKDRVKELNGAKAK